MILLLPPEWYHRLWPLYLVPGSGWDSRGVEPVCAPRRACSPEHSRTPSQPPSTPPQSSSNLSGSAVGLGRARLAYCSMKEVLITTQVTGLLRKAVPGFRTGSNKQHSLTLWPSPCALFVLDSVREMSEQDVAVLLGLSSAHSPVANTSLVVAELHSPHCGSQSPAADGRT